VGRSGGLARPPFRRYHPAYRYTLLPREPRYRPSPCPFSPLSPGVRFPSLRAIVHPPSSRAGILQGWTRAGRWSLNQVYSGRCLRRVGCAAAKPPLRARFHFPPLPSHSPFSFPHPLRGVAIPVHSNATAQLSRRAFPGEATNLREPGQHKRGRIEGGFDDRSEDAER